MKRSVLGQLLLPSFLLLESFPEPLYQKGSEEAGQHSEDAY